MIQSIHEFTTKFSQKLSVILVSALILLVGPLSWLLVRGIVNPIHELTRITDEYSLGNLELSIPATGRTDEIGRLSSAIERLGTSIKLAMKRLQGDN